MLPHFTPLLSTATPGKKEQKTEFGKKWKELVLPLGAIRIKVFNGAISSLKNVVADDMPRLAMLGQFSASERTYIFQLLDGEAITKVETHVGQDYMHAIRFHTTLRVSLWFGSPKGEIRAIAAPEGGVIRSLYGAWGRGLRELGAVCVPIEELTEPSPKQELSTVQLPPLVDLDVATGDFCAAFNEVCRHALGAIVVSVDEDIKWLCVLSRDQVQQLMVLQDGIYPGDHEQWIDLVSGERVVKVEILDDDEVVVGVRLTTTLRTTPWIGVDPAETEDIVPVVYTCESGVSVCGFHYARGRNGVTRLGLVVAKPQDHGSGDKSKKPVEMEVHDGTCPIVGDDSESSSESSSASDESDEDEGDSGSCASEESAWDVVGGSSDTSDDSS